MQTAIVLFAHGARDPEWAGPLLRVKAAMERSKPEQSVALAFLEFMTPNLPQSVADLVAQGARNIIIQPMFIAQGGHLKRDLPQMIAQLRSTWPATEFCLLPAIGEAEAVVQAMAECVLATANDVQ